MNYRIVYDTALKTDIIQGDAVDMAEAIRMMNVLKRWVWGIRNVRILTLTNNR